MNGFETQLNKGKRVEEKVQNTLTNRGWTVVDRSHDREYQLKDIDFEISQGEEKTTVEVKGDYRLAQTGNICVELITNLERGHLGWIDYCQAEYMFYTDSINSIAYCFRMEDLRKFLKDQGYSIKRIHSYDRQDHKIRVLGLVKKERFENYLKENNLFYQELELN